MEEVIGYFPQSRPIKIALRRKIVLITVLAMEIAQVSDMPLEMELIFHANPPTGKMSNKNILRSFEVESQVVLRLIESPLISRRREAGNFHRTGSNDFLFLKEYGLCRRSQKPPVPSQQTIGWLEPGDPQVLIPG